jgi:branched-chain amino acid transport system ATP-binding protein
MTQSASNNAPLLAVTDLHVSYGGIQAVKGINFEVHAGEVVALIGANGAGKSSTLKALSGLLRPASGQIIYNGEPTAAIPSHGFAERGLVMVPEGRGVFSRFTVHENLLMGAYCRHDKAAMDQDLDKVYQLFPRLKERDQQLAGTLSGGEQQMVAIARAMMARPRLLLLDEPSMGLAPLIVQKIFEIIHQIANDGVTLLLVEQNARLALKTAQRGYVMESGRITCADSAQALLNNPNVQRAYLGE